MVWMGTVVDLVGSVADLVAVIVVYLLMCWCLMGVYMGAVGAWTDGNHHWLQVSALFVIAFAYLILVIKAGLTCP